MLGINFVMSTVLFLSALTVIFITHQTATILEYRHKYSEALAVHYAILSENGDRRAIQEALDSLVQRNEDIVSATVKLANGKILPHANQIQEVWQHPKGASLTANYIHVPIFHGAERWGNLQLQFLSLDGGWLGWLNDQGVWILGLVVGLVFLGYFLQMKQALRQVFHSTAEPLGVNASFDVLIESIVFLNKETRIISANLAFGHLVGKDSTELRGKRLGDFFGMSLSWGSPLTQLPWVTALKGRCLVLDFPITLLDTFGKLLKFRANCIPLLNMQEEVMGVVVSLNNVTMLAETICALESSKAELECLAMRDSLTGCLNRRALFKTLEDLYNFSSSEGRELGCIMIDIDHFKSFNDRLGHAVGDRVLEVVAKILSSTIRPTDFIGRYGGEEFCVLLPEQDIEETTVVAERLRQAIEVQANQMVRTTGKARITMSFGTSCLSLGATHSLELVDQADKALYAAKQAGRNQVGQWTREGPLVGQLIELELMGVSDKLREDTETSCANSSV